MKLRPYLNARVKLLVVALTVFALLPACIVVVEKDNHRDHDYYRRRWQLEVFVYGSTVYTPRDAGAYTVAFSQNDVLTGQADCVSFEGRYAVGRSNTLSIDGLTPQQSACGEDFIADRFLEELAGARSISGGTDELVIHLEDSDNLMRFSPN